MDDIHLLWVTFVKEHPARDVKLRNLVRRTPRNSRNRTVLMALLRDGDSFAPLKISLVHSEN